MTPTFTCGCQQPTHLYRVTDHAGHVETYAYCADCASLAALDWYGNTCSIEPMTCDAYWSTVLGDHSPQRVVANHHLHAYTRDELCDWLAAAEQEAEQLGADLGGSLAWLAWRSLTLDALHAAAQP